MLPPGRNKVPDGKKHAEGWIGPAGLVCAACAVGYWLFTPVIMCPASWESTVPYITRQEKDQKSKFEVWFLLKTYSFHTVVRSKNRKMNHLRLKSVCVFTLPSPMVSLLYQFYCFAQQHLKVHLSLLVTKWHLLSVSPLFPRFTPFVLGALSYFPFADFFSSILLLKICTSQGSALVSILSIYILGNPIYMLMTSKFISLFSIFSYRFMHSMIYLTFLLGYFIDLSNIYVKSRIFISIFLPLSYGSFSSVLGSRVLPNF